MNVLLAQLQFKKYITTINNHDDVVKQKQASPKQIEASASFVTNAKAITNVLNYIMNIIVKVIILLIIFLCIYLIPRFIYNYETKQKSYP